MLSTSYEALQIVNKQYLYMFFEYIKVTYITSPVELSTEPLKSFKLREGFSGDDVFFEDTISIVNYTDSQKSIATTNAHSPDRTDTSSGKSRGTYVIAVDSDLSVAAERGRSDHRGPGSDRDHRIDRRAEGDGSDCSDGSRRRSPPVHGDCGVISAKPPVIEIRNLTLAEGIAESSDAHVHRTTERLYACSLVSREIFTQTSKTLFELAQINHLKCTNIDTNAIETQTSRVSIIENKTTEYRIEVSGSRTRYARQELLQDQKCDRLRPRSDASGGNSLDDPDRASSETLKVIEEEPKSQCEYKEQLELSDETSENAYSLKYDTDFTDSLEDDNKRGAQDNISETSVPKSVDRDVEELYTKLEESFDLRSSDKPQAYDVLRHGMLSPLTEETAISKSKEILNRNIVIKPELEGESNEDREHWRLPPIQRQVSPWSPDTPGAPEHGEAMASWKSACGTAKTGRAEPPRLPAIVGCGVRRARSRGDAGPPPPRAPLDTISISGKIQQLKLPVARKGTSHSYTAHGTPATERFRLCLLHDLSDQAQGDKAEMSSGSPQVEFNLEKTSESRSGSPEAAAATRGADALAADVLARLRHATSAGAGAPLEGGAGAARFDGSDSCGAKWAEAVEVLEDVPVLFRGFWRAVPERRVADLLRLVTAQVESPRTRVVTAACAALAALLPHTGYTKKPEFTEAVSALLVKTGSRVAPVRRAANLALDAVVARAPPAAAVAALCHAGLQHASAAVRGATARLLVVCAALARGGRELLRARPPAAAAARRAALRALSRLLQDRSQDTRRYAERLYVMLRPLDGFAAFFLADVDARTACRQMKKYDRLLAPGGAAPSPRRS